jgi:PAS domain S-box-containing protein
MTRFADMAIPRYLIAIFAVIVATAARRALDPLLGDHMPFATLLLAVLVVAGYAGRGAALAAVGLGAASSAYFLLPPRDRFAVEGLENQVGLVLYIAIGAGIASLGGALRESRRRAERIALESDRRRQQMQITLDSIGDAVLVADAQGRVTFLNPVAETLTGWSSPVAAGRPVSSIFRSVDEETRRPVDDPASRALREGVVVGPARSTILIAGDGRERPVEDSAAPIRDDQGRVSGAVLIFRDASERLASEKILRRNEARLRLFVEHTPAAIAMLDRDMRYLLVSRRWSADFDLGDVDVRGRDHYEVMPEVPDRWRQVHRRCLAGAVERAEEDLYVRPDGREEWLRWETRPWRDDRGEIGGIIIFSQIISEQIRDRRVIQQHAETLSGILAATVDNIYVVDCEGRYRFVSDGGARVLGFEPGEVVGRHWSELGLAADVMGAYMEQFRQVLGSGRPARHEDVFRSADGEPREYEYTVAPIIREDRPADAVVVVSRDVTNQKVTERDRLELLRTLKTRNAFIDAVQSQVPAAIVVSDAKTGRILMSNHEAHRIVRHEYEPGRTLDDYGTTYILAAFRPDGSRYGPRDWPLVRAQGGETVVAEEMELLLRDGSRLTIRVNAGPIRVGDELVAAVVAYHDITDRKASEQAARFLADASAVLAGLLDDEVALQKLAALAVPTFADWAVVDMAEADGSIKRLAVAHADPTRADLARELHRRYPADPAATLGPAHVLRTGRSEFLHEVTDQRLMAGARDEDHLRLLRELGLRSYLCVPLLVRGETLGVLGFALARPGRLYGEHDLAIAEDLASRAAIAIENARLYRELKQADRMKNEFLATLAHELRNPLAPIRNGLHLMKQTAPDREANEVIRAMAERQVVHLTRLIDDLMDVARISRGKIELHREVVDLSAIVNQAVETSRPLIEERRHRLTVSLPDRAVRLEADPTRLEQVLWNLLNNAAKYSDPGGRIHLAVEPDGADVLIRLKDSGVGIRPEMLARIFEMFTQVEDHRKHAGGGLGIGLGLVRALVELHGGSISARSDGPGLGSEFAVRLPILPTAPASDGSTRSPAARRDLGPERRRILVVDDNKDAAKSLAILLSTLHGQDARVAFDGPSALDLAEEFRPEVLLLDLGLPEMDGYDVARSIRRRPWGAEVMIIALTGWGQEEDRRRSEEAGFNHHLVKPVNPIILEQLLADLRTEPRAGTVASS